MEGDSVDEGGYDYDFVDSLPDRLICKICQSPCREAQLTKCCGHVFCKCCIKQLRSSATVSQACPMCRVEPFDAFPHREAEREIKALKVHCPNKEDSGCEWTGKLAGIVARKLPQKCERCDKCDNIIHYSDIARHLPTNCSCYCPHCDTTADREVICSEHKEKCHRYPQACPNNCGQYIPQEDMDDHKKVCPLEMIQCEYQCGARIARNEVEKHNLEMMTKHIQLARHVLSELKIAQLAEKNKAKQFFHNIATSPIGLHFTTVLVVLCVVIAALLLQPYYTTADHDLIIKEVQNSISSMKAQNDEELTKARSLIVQLQNDIKDLKVKETEHLEKLRQCKLLVKQI